MVLEVAILNVRPGREPSFETAFAQAESIIAASPGYISHQLQRCLENPSRVVIKGTSIYALRELIVIQNKG
ncbi:MAG: antibiotic biosynthesis monooxygenase, partial [Gloeomargaritaceae cyanobacterium C42_A2020_066]|nr:antibiotic biosynthesis monooxygenase [Gloeomargaritaceae cyanobacterium C42_A2020_066]